MDNQLKLTINNWRSEYERLKTRHKKIHNKTSLEALGYLDHMRAVRSIIRDMEDKSYIQ